jgi:hypothetical protein
MPKKKRRKRIPICLGTWSVPTTDGQEFECGYGVGFTCEQCKVNGGDLDPRDGDPEMGVEPWTDEDVEAELKYVRLR